MSEAQVSHPITASEGIDNAFYHNCQAVEHNSPYASCLNKLKMQKSGKMPPVFSECKTAIQSGKCVAESMREEELGKGVAIYYIPRAQVRAVAEAREAIAAQKMLDNAGKTSAKESKRKSKMGLADIDYSSAPLRQQTVRAEVQHAVVKEVAFDMSAAMARVITEEAAKVNMTAPVVPAKTVVKPAVEISVKVETTSVEGRKSMIEIAREMAAKRKAEQAVL